MRKNSVKQIIRQTFNQDNDLHLSEFKTEAHAIAKKNNVKLSDVRIYYHETENEYCIEIKGFWWGYLSDET